MSNFKVHVSSGIIQQVQVKAAVMASFAGSILYLGTFEYGKGCSSLRCILQGHIQGDCSHDTKSQSWDSLISADAPLCWPRWRC